MITKQEFVALLEQALPNATVDDNIIDSPQGVTAVVKYNGQSCILISDEKNSNNQAAYIEKIKTFINYK